MKFQRIVVLTRSLLPSLLLAICLPGFTARAGFATIPYGIDFETGALDPNHWTLQGSWGLTTETAHAGTNSLTDSPQQLYATNADSSAVLGVDLRHATRPLLRFWQSYALQPNRDFAFVEVSGDNGATWTRWSAWSGLGGTNWHRARLDLEDYAGRETLIRWRLKADGHTQYDGWYIDDVQVEDNAAVASYPFCDFMDDTNSPAKWLNGCWRQESGGAQSSDGQSWRCRVGDNWAPGGDISCALTLAGTMDLTSSVNPRLSFWWRAGSQYINTLYAQASGDGGKTWDTVWNWSSGGWNSSPWSHVQVDLSEYQSREQVTLRFLAYNGNREYTLDFQVDEVIVAEAPTDVNVTVVAGTDPRHAARVNWTASSATDFESYRIYRSTSATVDPGDQLVANITNKATLTFEDTGLAVCGQTYYYRVLVWATNGLHNWGAGDATYRTAWGATAVTYPYTNGLETGDSFWALDWPWAITTEIARTGTHSLTDSPGDNYLNNTDASATLRVNLGTLDRPYLSFWQLCSLQLNRDFGFVEVSGNDGANWTRWSALTGYTGTNWQQQRLDLTPYSGSTALIRFRLKSDGSTPEGGWHLDDVEVRENVAVAGYPFHDAMDTDASQTNWLTAAGWNQIGGSAQTNSGQSWLCRVGDNWAPGGEVNCPLTLAGTMDFTTALKPLLSFWWRAGSQYINTLYAQVSPDGGKNWTTVWSWTSGGWNSSAWSKAQVDLASFIGYDQVALRFLAYGGNREYTLDFQVDDIVVDETPVAPDDTLTTVGPGADPRHSARLNWAESGETKFASYSIYRSTSPGVSISSLRVATITNRSTLTFEDTGLDTCGKTYYYRLIVWDTDGLHSTGSDLAYHTAWGETVTNFPFAEGFETGDAKWALDRPWVLNNEKAHGGTLCLTDSAGGNYANHLDASATVKVYLQGIARPVLSFWHLYSLQLNRDFGFVEISANDGASWTRWAAVTGYGGTNWLQQRLDLTPYAGNVVLIRFRLKTDASVQDNGWLIDDVEIKDNAAVAAYPFYDYMDATNSVTNWLASGAWARVGGSAQTNVGGSWYCQLGNNWPPGGDVNCALTLAGTFNLNSAINPRLAFWWRAGAQYINTLYAQISRDAGKNWETVWSWSSGGWNSSSWSQAQVDLSGYLGYSQVALRFIAYGGDREYTLDFQIDELVVAEAPPDVALAVVPGTDPRHNTRLNWSASGAADFACYRVYRATSTGVDPGDLLVTTISNKNTLTFEDTALDVCGRTYYYRVLVWATNGLHNWGTADATYRTAWGQTVTNFPFAESFEAGDSKWALDRPWAIGSQQKHSGTLSLTDSPGGIYDNSLDTSAALKVYLQGMDRPCLNFWHLFSLQENRDFGFVEVSVNDGASWTRWAAITGYGGTNWQQQRLDLTPYAGNTVLIRFRLKTDGSVQDDGWYIDDLEIKDNAAVAGYPFYDNMNSTNSATNWLTLEPWLHVGGSASTNAGRSWLCQLGNNWQPGGEVNCTLTLSGTMNFNLAVNPRLSFWWRAGSQYINTLYAQVSPDGGKNWSTVWSWSSGGWNASPWSRAQVDLAAYLGHDDVSLRFLGYSGDREYTLDFQIDEVLVDEGPVDAHVTVGPGTDPKHSALVQWNASTAQTFASYSIYRATHTNVAAADTLVAVLTNRNTLAFEDTGLALCGQTYYYRVLTTYLDGWRSPGLKDVAYRTAWGTMVAGLPFTDQFETNNLHWALDGAWQRSADESHGGAFSLTDSADGNYPNHANGGASLRLDLRGTLRPCLSFWHLYSLEQDRDYGIVEVSGNDGVTWSPCAAVTGYGGWEPQRIDLSPFAGVEGVIVRFRLKADQQNTDDGWFIDDVEIRENTAVAGYPFYDNMDSTGSRANWLAGTWAQVGGSAQTNAGQNWQCFVGDAVQPGNNTYGTNLYSGTLSPSLTLAGTLDLTGAISPKLWFWWHAGQQWYHALNAQISRDGGKNWETVWSRNTLDGGPIAWTLTAVDLTPYLGLTRVGLRFTADNPGNTPVLLDFSVDEVLVGEANAPTILTGSPLPDAIAGFGYSLTLRARNGTTPYTWSVVTNTLPLGLNLASNTGVISGNPSNSGTFTFWIRVADNLGASFQKPFTLTVQNFPAPLASQISQDFLAPGTNVVFCRIDNQTTNRFLSLVWSPALPPGWSIVNVSGDGNPSLGPDGKILFQSFALTSQSLHFTYQVRVPSGQGTSGAIGGALTYLIEGMMNEATVAASPDPLLLNIRVYHSADCDKNWVVNTAEASRTLAYWRAQAYQLYEFSCDGYAPGAGVQVGPTHSADYRTARWQIDGTEINRVLAYWRAGCYHADTNGVDGYVAGCGSPKDDPQNPVKSRAPSIVHQVPSSYSAGSLITVSNQFDYTGDLISLLWRPLLPTGWGLQSVSGSGSPELIAGEIVWTGGNLPPGPIALIYTVQIPADASGPQQIRGEVEYQTNGMANAAVVYADPDPATLSTGGTGGALRFTAIRRLEDGTIQLDMEGTVDAPVRVLYTYTMGSNWITLETMPSLTGADQCWHSGATNWSRCFYRLVSP